MGTLGGGEILLILVLALLLFGPRSLPKIGKTIGRGLAEFRKASNELRSNLEREVELEELKQVKDDVKSVSRELSDPLAAARKLDEDDVLAGRSTPGPAVTPSADGEDDSRS